MNRRKFLYSTAAGFVAVQTVRARGVAEEATTPLFVRGLAMVKFSDPEYLRIALPEAPHHAATIATLPPGLGADAPESEWNSRRLEGDISLTGVAPGGANPDVRLREVIQMRELYPGSVGNFDDSPTVISIPWTAVRGVSSDVLSEDRWTFVWKETGEEVLSFRPRQVAESIRIDIVSDAVLEVGGKERIPLHDVSQVRTQFVPEHEGMGDFSEHFVYYMPYIDTPEPANPVQPKKLGAAREASSIRGANAAFARMYPFFVCFMIEVD